MKEPVEDHIPSSSVMSQTRSIIRKFLLEQKLFYQEREYPHFSVFRLHGTPIIEIDLLGFECEAIRDGDVFINQPFYDSLFGAGGAKRLGQVNVLEPGFEDALRALVKKD